MKCLCIVLIPLLAGALGCASPKVDLEVERQTVLTRDKEWAAAAAANDLERTLSYWTEDAIVMPPGAPSVVGKAAIRQMVAESMKIPGFRISWEATSVVVAPGGEFAYETAKNQVTLPDSTGRVVTTHGKGVAVWRKDADGMWRCVIDIWNNDPAPTLAAPNSN